MGCNQSASKPVPRPTDSNNNMSTSTTNGSTTNGHIPTALGSSSANNGVSVNDVNLQTPNGSGSTQPASATINANASQASHGQFPHSHSLGPAQTHPSLTIAKHRPLIVCGPSGVGKGTLLTRLLKEYPHVFAKSVSHTTRGPRSGEVHGQHYHFTTPTELLQAVKEGKFIEHADVHGNYYGTSISSVAHVMDAGKICLLEIDIQGFSSVKKIPSLNPLAVFVRAPTFEDLVKRLNGRGTETEATMARRLESARNEMDFFYTNRHMFEGDVINDEVETSYKRLTDTIQRLYPTVKLTPIAQSSTPAVSTNGTTPKQ